VKKNGPTSIYGLPSVNVTNVEARIAICNVH